MVKFRNAGLSFAAAIFIAAVATAHASEDGCKTRLVGGINTWRTIGPGMEVRKIQIRFEDGTTSRMTAARLDPDQFDIRLRWQAGKNIRSEAVRIIAQMTKAAVVVNAGYFDEKGRPLGYFRTADTIFNSRLLFRGRRRALHLGAVFYVLKGSGKVGIATREDFDSKGVREAFQAGPYLVRGGRPDPGLDAYREYRRADRRTILAFGEKGRLIFMVSEEIGRGISWCELQNFLVRSEPDGGLGAIEAMNLDGGSSSQLVVQGDGYLTFLAGRIVPALVLAVPRGGGGGS
ncbi:MAG: phosphodiester glycosidase family protein [Nitrospinota bacterium]